MRLAGRPAAAAAGERERLGAASGGRYASGAAGGSGSGRAGAAGLAGRSAAAAAGERERLGAASGGRYGGRTAAAGGEARGGWQRARGAGEAARARAPGASAGGSGNSAHRERAGLARMRRRDGAGSSARIPGGALVHQLLEMESVAGEKTSGVADRPVVFLDSSSLCTWAPTVALCVTALDSGQKEEHGPAARDARPSALFPQAQDARGDGLVGMVLLLRRKEELRKSVLFRWILLPLISANFVAVVGFSTPTLCMD